MHAEHADNSEVNELSGRVIVLCNKKRQRTPSWSAGISFKLIHLGKLRLSIKRVAHGL
jgi:hypothetical protein